MRKIVCARVKDTGEFDVVGMIVTTEKRDQAPSQCPLVPSLVRTQGESHDNLFSDFVRLGILQLKDGHFDFTEMDHPCPYTQAQQMEHKQS